MRISAREPGLAMMRVTGFSLGSNWGIDEWPDKVRVSHDTRPNVSRVYVPERHCEWILEHGGAIYDRWQCGNCGFLYVENRCDHGIKDGFDPKYCPGCGAKVVDAV